MVATSLPFWMHPSRAMPPFADFSAQKLSPALAGGNPSAATAALARRGVSVSVCGAGAMAAHEAAWADLAARALEPNVFMEPGFALPALLHFPPSQRPDFLLVWAAEAADMPRLIGLVALRPVLTGFGPRVSVAWHHDQGTMSAPLLDRDRAGEALDVMLAWLAGRSSAWCSLLLRGLPADGALMRLLGSRARHVVEVDRRERVVLRRREAGAPAGSATEPGHAKELRRQRRRLADQGTLAYRSASEPEAVREAAERFLALEARGWKGGRGTALLADAGLAAFSRAMTRRLARTGLCRIDALELDGEAVAMGIVLRSGDRAFYWKTCFDERLRRLSPGKQFAAMLGEAQAADPSVALTDSCAVPNHSMIGHVWGDRMDVVDVLLAGPAVAGGRVKRAARVIGLLRSGREALKTGRNGLLRLLRRHG